MRTRASLSRFRKQDDRVPAQRSDQAQYGWKVVVSV